MDVYDYRRENVRWLCQKEHGGSISEMANRLDRQQSLISRWIGKTRSPKPIGSRTARRIERQYKKPDGWLDIPHDMPRIKEGQAIYERISLDMKRAALSDEAVEFAEGYQSIPEYIRRYFRLLLNDALVKEYGNKEIQKTFAESSLKEQLHFQDRLKKAGKRIQKKIAEKSKKKQ